MIVPNELYTPKQLSKMLTEKQIYNLRNLPKTDLLAILDICTEELGLISPDEYCRATGTKRSTYYWLVQQNKIETYKISQNNYPLINYKYDK